MEVELIVLESFEKSFKELNKTWQALIQLELEKILEGNPGNVRNLKEGVYEKKINKGPGYRVYFGMEDQKIYVLLLVKPKSKQQSQDIAKAKEIWKDYND